MTPDQQTQLQTEVQRELERREWAEPNDNVMAEYITVLLANGSTKERVQTEMDDLVGSDFDSHFLDWLFDIAHELTTTQPEAPAPSRSPPVATSTSRHVSGGAGGSRLLNSALAPLANQPEKRKFEDRDRDEGANKRRVSDGPIAHAPTGPRGMSSEGRSLADRLGPSNRARGGMAVRGMGRGPMNNGPGFGPAGFSNGMNRAQPPMMQPGFGGFFPPGQQEMMAQMMMMQANMAQMGEMMNKMVEEKEVAQAAAAAASSAPVIRPKPAKIPPGTKLGKHSVSVVPPKRNVSPGPIPEKPTSKALCRYSTGCSNSRCTYSHPSPVADEKTGMVLSDEACEEGKNCKDAGCIKSHVSPAVVHGEHAGPSRMLCKYQNCTNPSCQFRHEDSNGNTIPPPALSARQAAKDKPAPATVVPVHDANMSDNEDNDFEVVVSGRGLMDGPLEDKKMERPCRFGERCTRADCKFGHPPSRPTPKGAKPTFGKPSSTTSVFGSMNRSKKFGAAAAATGAGETKTLDPTVSEFKPATAV